MKRERRGLGLVGITLLFFMCLGAWWFLNVFSYSLSPRITGSKTECESYLAHLPIQRLKHWLGTEPFSLYFIFLDDLNPFPQKPVSCIHRALMAIQARQRSGYQAAFEESTIFPLDGPRSGDSGRFANLQVKVVDSDSQIAVAQVQALWIPTEVESKYPRDVVLVYCETLYLVRSRKNLDVIPAWNDNGSQISIGIGVPGWYLREDQANRIPYDFSGLFEQHIKTTDFAALPLAPSSPDKDATFVWWYNLTTVGICALIIGMVLMTGWIVVRAIQKKRMKRKGSVDPHKVRAESVSDSKHKPRD